MAFSWIPKIWQDWPSTNTLVRAEDLNNYEQGFSDVADNISAVEGDIATNSGALAGKANGTALSLPGIAGNYASAPYAAAMGIPGDIDVRWVGSMDDWTPAASPALVSRYTSGQRHFDLLVHTTGTIRLIVSTDGTTSGSKFSTAATGFTDGEVGGVRITIDADNGAGGYDITFYTSTDDGVTWTQLGSVVTTAGAATFGPSTAGLEVGSSDNGAGGPLAGTVRRVEVRDGIDGTIVANPDFTRGTIGKDGVGNVWTINGSDAGYVYSDGSAAPVEEYADYAQLPGATFTGDVSVEGSLTVGEAVGAAGTLDIPDDSTAGTQEVRALTYPATITAGGHGTFNGVTVAAGYDINADHAVTTNTRYGYGAMNPAATAGQNTAIGYECLPGNTNGGSTTAVGYRAGYGVVTGSEGTYFGSEAFYTGGGTWNTAIGKQSLYSLTGGNDNVALGNQAMKNCPAGSRSIAIGSYAGKYMTASNQELFINSLDRTDRAGDVTKSIIYGQQAAAPADQVLTLNASVAATYGVNVGEAVGAATTLDIPDDSTAETQEIRALTYPATITAGGHGTFNGVTVAAGYDINAAHAAGGTTRYGDGAVKSTATGANNVGIGYRALGDSLSTGTSNTAVGYYAGRLTSGGSYNSYFGLTAGHNNTVGVGNTGIGFDALYSATGSNNISLGHLAGRWATSSELFVSSMTHADRAGDQTGSIIYGVQATAAADQVLTLNASVAIGGAASLGGGKGAIFLGDSDTVPTSDPVGGGILFSEDGSLKWRGSGGTITTIASA